MAARSLCPRLDPCVSVAGLLRFLHPYPNAELPTLIGDSAIDAHCGFRSINALQDLGLLGVERNGLIKALSKMVQPGGAVMPYDV